MMNIQQILNKNNELLKKFRDNGKLQGNYNQLQYIRSKLVERIRWW